MSAIAPTHADYSAIATLAECPRRYFYAIESGYVPREPNVALHGGTAIHAGLHEWYAGGSEDESVAAAMDAWGAFTPPPERSYYTAGHVEVILRNYFEDRAHESVHPIRIAHSSLKHADIVDFAPSVDDDGNVVFAETPLAVRLRGDLVYAGLIDLPAEIHGDVYIVDHKTTGQWLTERWATQYARSFQLKGYIKMFEVATGLTVAGAYVNGVYTGKEAADDLSKWRKRTSFRNRLFGPYVYSRQEIDEVEEWASEWLYFAERMRDNSEGYAECGDDPALAWPQNDRACDYCAFAPVCHAAPSIRPGLLSLRYVKRPRTGILLSGADSDTP